MSLLVLLLLSAKLSLYFIPEVFIPNFYLYYEAPQLLYLYSETFDLLIQPRHNFILYILLDLLCCRGYFF